ncbi:Prophage CP4-57 regulatory protein (AlpA) [Collimonas sp. OK607]|uniref:helix-turn-helix transcriptional regulator n=1 Tax=Collimonas sp. OK607 TaxID=1798194 RepID=UPI0008F29C10|nr:AlpA family phage regulatory protein [Collimonas sp. OK607]SFB19357.1 Prophage CP4-57 regulatory protein (AlpA) [Collimonas sp. OK607]
MTVPLACLQMKALTKKLSMSRSSIYKLIQCQESNFPVGFPVMGGRAMYYIESEVDEWLISQRQKSQLMH